MSTTPPLPPCEVQIAESDRVSDLVAAIAAASRAGDAFVIADFDRTITRCFCAGGSRGISAHGVLESANVLSENFQTKAKALFEKYYPVEIDPHMPISDKIPLMNEWYSQVHALMLEEGVTRDKIRDAVAGCANVQFRDGIEALIRKCQEHSPPIPLLIMSAGLGDVIDEILRQRLPFPLAASTAVLSNRMVFGVAEDGKLSGFSEPLLHMFNKTAATLPPAEAALIGDRHHCVLLGDSVGDLTMADGLDVKVLKIGFLNEKVPERMPQYLGPFDVVVTNDGPVPDVCFRALGIEC